MRKLIVVALVAAFATTAFGTWNGAYTGPFLYNWDFTNGSANGWTLNGAAAVYAGQGLRIGDTDSATMPMPAIGVTNKWVFQCDITNLSATYLQGIGLAALQTADNKGVKYTGCASTGTRAGTTGIDSSYNNTNYRDSYTQEDAGYVNMAYPNSLTLQIDWGYTTPGAMSWNYQTAYTSARGAANTWRSNNGPNGVVTDVLHSFDFLMLGGIPNTGTSTNTTGAPWGQAWITNAHFVPEPSAICLLALGGLGLLRRRK